MLPSIACIDHTEAQTFVNSPPTIGKATLFAGAKLWGCDEILALKDEGGRILGLVTIAADGEDESGVPTIVALYVVHEARRRAYGVSVGALLFAAAVERCIARGFEKTRVDVLSTGMMRLIDGLDARLRDRLDIHTGALGTQDAFADVP